jgi:hypothetical protein
VLVIAGEPKVYGKLIRDNATGELTSVVKFKQMKGIVSKYNNITEFLQALYQRIDTNDTMQPDLISLIIKVVYNEDRLIEESRPRLKKNMKKLEIDEVTMKSTKRVFRNKRLFTDINSSVMRDGKTIIKSELNELRLPEMDEDIINGK